MADLSFSFSPQVQVAGLEETRTKQLTRLSGPFPADTALNVNNPGPEWELDGETITFSNEQDFLENVKVYRNGQLLDTGQELESCDVFPLISGPQSNQIVFKMFIAQNDIIQIWKYIEN